MSLVSFIPKVLGYGSKALHYGKEAVKAYPSFVFGKSAEAAVSAVKNAPVKDMFTVGAKAIKNQAALEAANGSIFKQAWNALKSTPRTIAVYAKKGAVEAGIKGGGKLAKAWGGLKGVFKGIGKKMPLIGNILLVASYLPNIFTATKEQGIGAGVKETLKSGAKLGGAALGSAIGTAICPGIGSLIGWFAGEWLTGKIVGKDYTTQKAEAQEKAEEEMAYLMQLQQNLPQNAQYQSNPFMANAYGIPNNGYSNDIMAQNLKLNTMA